MTSEGSKCEKLTKSNNIATSPYKVGAKLNENSEEPTSSQQAMSFVPLDYEEDIPFLVRLVCLPRKNLGEMISFSKFYLFTSFSSLELFLKYL